MAYGVPNYGMGNGYNPVYMQQQIPYNASSIGNYTATNMAQQMQPTLPQNAQMQANPSIQGRMVTSKEEALAVPVDFSGNPVFLADLAHGKIFVKKLNLNTGAADFAEFVLNVPQQEMQQQPQAQHETQQMPAFAKEQDLQELQSLVHSLQKELDELKKTSNTSSDKGGKK